MHFKKFLALAVGIGVILLPTFGDLIVRVTVDYLLVHTGNDIWAVTAQLVLLAMAVKVLWIVTVLVVVVLLVKESLTLVAWVTSKTYQWRHSTV